MNDETSDHNDSVTLAERGTELAHNLKDHAQEVIVRGKRRSEKLVGTRQKNSLLRELGVVFYDAHLDGEDTLDISRRDEICAALDALQT